MHVWDDRYAWLAADHPSAAEVAGLAARQVRLTLTGRLRDEWEANELVSDTARAVKHAGSDAGRKVAAVVRAIAHALNHPGHLPDYASEEDEALAARSGTVEDVLTGDLSKVPTLWAACGVDVSAWPQELFPVGGWRLQRRRGLAALDVETMVGSVVVIRQPGDRVEGTLLAVREDVLVVATHEEDPRLNTLAVIPRGQVLSVGVYHEMLPWRLADEADAAGRS